MTSASLPAHFEGRVKLFSPPRAFLKLIISFLVMESLRMSSGVLSASLYSR